MKRMPSTVVATVVVPIIQFVQNMLLGAIVSGVGILGAQYWGKKDTEKLGEIFGMSIHESLLISIVFFIGCRWYPEKLMLLFAHDPELVAIGAEYLRIASWSYLLTGVSQCYLAIMRVSEHASRSAWISSGATFCGTPGCSPSDTWRSSSCANPQNCCSPPGKRWRKLPDGAAMSTPITSAGVSNGCSGSRRNVIGGIPISSGSVEIDGCTLYREVGVDPDPSRVSICATDLKGCA